MYPCAESFFDSRTAIARAIIDLLLVFHDSKKLNCFGALSFFYNSKRSIGFKVFFTGSTIRSDAVLT